MKDVFDPRCYTYQETAVEFATSDKKLKELFDKAEELCKKNRKNFDGYNVLIEGEKYNGVWLETQPMGGEMYAKRDIGAALSNILIFMRNQRADGKLPGMITYDSCVRTQAYYAWMQGCFLPDAAFKLYYLTGKEPEYLMALYKTLENFDGSLRVNARSIHGIIYAASDYSDEMFLVNESDDGVFPSGIDKYRV